MLALPRRAILHGATLSAALAATGCASLLVPRAEPLPRWAAHTPGATQRVDHSALTAFLQRYLTAGTDGVNRLAYRRIGAADRAALQRYIADLSAIAVHRLDRDEQFAYWVNLYNAATVETVLAHYPVTSILDIAISPGLVAPGPWGKPLLQVEAQPLSLGDIEHGILRPLWRDARAHYALNCASIGCPNLRAEAWSSVGLDGQLDAAARAYANHPRGARGAGGRLTVSSIYAWYEQDFGGSEGAVVRHLRGLGAAVAGFERYDEHAYDWALNDSS